MSTRKAVRATRSSFRTRKCFTAFSIRSSKDDQIKVDQQSRLPAQRGHKVSIISPVDRRVPLPSILRITKLNQVRSLRRAEPEERFLLVPNILVASSGYLRQLEPVHDTLHSDGRHATFLALPYNGLDWQQTYSIIPASSASSMCACQDNLTLILHAAHVPVQASQGPPGTVEWS